MNPLWLDQVLFDLQSLPPERLTSWERDFLSNISLQVGKGQSLSREQLRRLMKIYRNLFNHIDFDVIMVYKPFDAS